MLLLLAGCAGIEPLDHPVQWRSAPGGVLENGCPDVSGSYDVRAAEAYPPHGGELPALTEVFGPGVLRGTGSPDQVWPALPAATTATLSATADRLQVRFRDKAEGEVSMTFRHQAWWGGSTKGAEGLFQCLELELGPALGLDGTRTLFAGVPHLFAQSDMAFVLLSRAQDGSLLVNHRISRVTLTGVLIGSQARWVTSVWWRYPPVPRPR